MAQKIKNTHKLTYMRFARLQLGYNIEEMGELLEEHGSLKYAPQNLWAWEVRERPMSDARLREVFNVISRIETERDERTLPPGFSYRDLQEVVTL